MFLFFFFTGDSRVEASDLDEEEEEEDEDEEEDEEDSVPVVVEANKAKDVAPPVGVSSSDFKEDDAPSPPKVSPVAASPSFPAAKPVHDDDEEEEDEDYNVQGSGAGTTGGSRGTGTSVGRDGGSGAGSISGVDDEDEEEEDYDDNSDVEDIDINSVITEPETPRPPPTPVKPEKKPEVVVVAPPAPQPTKAPVDRGFPTAPTTVTTPPMIEVRSEKAPSTTEQPSTTTTTVRSPPIGGSSDRAGADPGSDVHILDHKPEDRPTSFFAQPGILAGELLFLASSSCLCVYTLIALFPLCVCVCARLVASGENFRPFPLGYPLESRCISAASFSHMASLLFPHPPTRLLFFFFSLFFACIGAAANSI